MGDTDNRNEEISDAEEGNSEGNDPEVQNFKPEVPSSGSEAQDIEPGTQSLDSEAQDPESAAQQDTEHEAQTTDPAALSAKPREREHKVRNRVIIICVIVLVALICVGGIGIGQYFVYYSLSPSSSSDERNVEGSTSYTFESEASEKAIADAYEATTTPTSITSADGLKLHADMTRNNDSHVWVICIHGYKGTNAHMMQYGARYAERGYNVLLPDNRAHGQSEGEYIGMGWLDKDDIELWIDWIIEQDEDAQILLHGVSMGAATTMMVSGDNPPHVIGYIEDCGYTSVWDIFGSELDKRYGLPTFPVLDLANTVSQWKAGYDFKEASCVDQVAKCEKPMLFIHGEDDDFVPVEMGYEVYEAANCEKEFYLVEGAGHAQAIYKDPDAYWDTVFNFIYSAVADATAE